MIFEYTTVKVSTSGFFSGGRLDPEALTLRLNELGRQGWELVSCVGTTMGYGQTRDVVAVLKRGRG